MVADITPDAGPKKGGSLQWLLEHAAGAVSIEIISKSENAANETEVHVRLADDQEYVTAFPSLRLLVEWIASKPTLKDLPVTWLRTTYPNALALQNSEVFNLWLRVKADREATARHSRIGTVLT